MTMNLIVVDSFPKSQVFNHLKPDSYIIIIYVLFTVGFPFDVVSFYVKKAALEKKVHYNLLTLISSTSIK